MDTYKTVDSMKYSGTVGLHREASPQTKNCDGFGGNRALKRDNAESHRTAHVSTGDSV